MPGAPPQVHDTCIHAGGVPWLGTLNLWLALAGKLNGSTKHVPSCAANSSAQAIIVCLMPCRPAVLGSAVGGSRKGVQKWPGDNWDPCSLPLPTGERRRR